MSKSRIAIIGAGKVGAALAGRWADQGHEIIFGSRNPGAAALREVLGKTGDARSALREDAAAAADIVVLAVPWVGAEEAASALGKLNGKILIDTTNVLTFVDGQLIELPVVSSGADLLQAAAPDSRVVKAFNTLHFQLMAHPEWSAGPVTIPLAGDDAEAKAEVAALVREIGFESADVGPLRTARYLESLARLYIDILMQDRPDALDIYLRPRLK
jgi:NADPH-dependent F420 reductase